VAGAGGNAEVVSIAALAASRIGYKRFASAQVARARRQLEMTLAEFAEYLTGELGWPVTAEAVEYWEDSDAPPSEVYLASVNAGGMPPPGAAPLLDSVPHGFPASAIAGPWVTAYQFAHAGGPHYHADIAHVTRSATRSRAACSAGT
jgi:hypothetical protein